MQMRWKMFVDGEHIEASGGGYFDVINPATETKIAQVALGSKKDAKSAISAARKAFDLGEWTSKTPMERSVTLWKMADIVEAHIKELAELESKNSGKTIKYSTNSDMPFIIDNLRFFSGAARNLEGKSSANYSGIGTSIISREPIGVIGAIVPWNYPLYIAMWKIAPALAAGNTLVIKPSSYTPLTLLRFAELTKKLLPKGVLNVVTGPGDVIGSEIAFNKDVDMVALTGDVSTGKEVMRAASNTIKRVHLELGGKAPFIVLPDASINAATEGAIVSAFWNSAQDCTATTRVFVHESMYDNFTSMLIKKAKKMKIGNPMDPHTDMGPLISKAQLKKTMDYVKIGIEEGAKLEIGGRVPKGIKKGYFYEPTIFSNASSEMRICKEEIFGPVLPIIPYNSLDDAISMANNVKYGLAASVWGSNITKLMDAASRLDFGTVWINEHGMLVSEMPHGGFKQSGFGKDLSMYSLEEYTRVKHIYIDRSGLDRKPWYYVVYGDKK